jgi:hypothetical protein
LWFIICCCRFDYFILVFFIKVDHFFLVLGICQNIFRFILNFKALDKLLVIGFML